MRITRSGTRPAWPIGLVASGALVATAVLSGCGSDSQDSSSLTFMTGGGVYMDALNEAYIQPFEQESGIEVHNDPTLSYSKVKTMVDAGNVTIDVIPAEGYWAVQQCGELLQPLDPETVDTSDIDPALMQSECAAPLLTYSSALYYSTDSYPSGDKPAGCRDFFDTATFPGKRGAYSGALPNPLVECALIADGVAPDQLYPLDLERAFAKINSIKDDLVFWNSGTDSTQLMAAGEVSMILAWNGRAYAAMAEQDAKFAQAYGESFTHYDALVVPKGVKDADAAMKLVDFMMDPQRQAALTTLIPYSPANQKAELGELPKELREFLPDTNPKLASGVIVQDQKWWAENADTVTRLWEETFQG